MSYISDKNGGRPVQGKSGCSPRQFVLLILFIAFMLGGIFFGFVFLVNATDFLQRIIGDRVSLPVSLLGSSDDAPDWANKERVNILLLGVDQRADQRLRNEPVRTDTMIVATVDPYGKTAGLLAIPRDLWVPIPMGQGRDTEDRINTANFFGELYKLPGGGPALAKKTVQYNFGVKIHYYALVDFDVFERLVDTLGGITVDVERPLIDDEYPTENYGIMRIFVPAGLQQMDGPTALQYARSRHQDSDLGRNKRQAQVLLAMRAKAMQLNIIPKLPSLIGEFSGSVRTDMSASDILKLANIGKEIDVSSIITRSLDDKQLLRVITQTGADVLTPKRAEIAKVINEVFFDPKLREENASIEILNASGVNGLSAKATDLLKGRGYLNVTYAATPEKSNSKDTRIVNYSGKNYTVQLIAKLLNVPSDKIENTNRAGGKADIQLILGQNARLPEN